jgi:hypothetical protein
LKDAPVDFRAADLNQLAQLKEFEAEAQAAGALTKSFKDDDGLKLEVGILLDRWARTFSITGSIRGSSDNSLPAAPYSAARNTAVATSSETDDDIGLFDIVENLQLHAESSGQFLHTLADELSAMTEVMNSVTSDFETIRNVRPMEPGETRPGIQKVANAMNKLSQLLEDELPSYAENLLAMGNDAREMVRVSYDWIGSDEDMLTHLWSFRGTLSTVSAVIGENRSSLEAMLDQTSRLQRTATNFNKAKRRLMQNATGLLEINDGGRSIIGVAIDELGRLIVAVEQHQRQRNSGD